MMDVATRAISLGDDYQPDADHLGAGHSYRHGAGLLANRQPARQL